jgi:hypothetical protein
MIVGRQNFVQTPRTVAKIQCLIASIGFALGYYTPPL